MAEYCHNIFRLNMLVLGLQIDMFRRRNNVSACITRVVLELVDSLTFSRLGIAFAVQLTLAQGLIWVVKEAETSWKTLEVLEAHFGQASRSNKVYFKRSLFKLQQDKLPSCHTDFELSRRIFQGGKRFETSNKSAQKASKKAHLHPHMLPVH